MSLKSTVYTKEAKKESMSSLAGIPGIKTESIVCVYSRMVSICIYEWKQDQE